MMIGIEEAFEKGWKNIWLECDSMLVIHAFKSFEVVPWPLRNRWMNSMVLANRMRYVYSHIPTEGNNSADALANFGFSISGFVWWNSIPLFLNDSFFRDRVGYPNYRFK